MKRKRAIIALSIVIVCLCFLSIAYFANKKICTQITYINLARRIQDKNRQINKTEAKRAVLQKEIDEIMNEIEAEDGVWKNRVEEIEKMLP